GWQNSSGTRQTEARMVGPWLCEVCFDALTTHWTAAWDGLETAVCEDCLAPPAQHVCWQALGASSGVAELIGDGQGYLVRRTNGATIHFRWGKPLRSRRTETGGSESV